MLDRVISTWASRTPEALALADLDRTLTWADLEARVRAMATSLGHARGVIALRIPASVDGVALLAAAAAAERGAIVINAALGEARAREIASGARAVGIARVVDGRAELELLADDAEGVDEHAGDEPRVWLLTSGTSGVPKRIEHTWRTIAGAVKPRERMQGQRWLLGYPVAQFAGLQVLAQSLSVGGALILPRETSPTAAVEALAARGAEYLSCTPTAMRLMLPQITPEIAARSGLRHVTLGGEAADQPTLDALVATFPGVRVTTTYASTEAGVVMTATDARAGFPASFVDGVALKIDDGHLFVRRSARSMLGEGDFIATGDLAEVRGDRVFVLGRSDDVVNVGGYKVMPSVVEDAARGVPGVLEIAVVGQKSSILGHLLKAFVRLQPGADRTATLTAIRAAWETSLPKPMIPRLVDVVEELPLTAAQKLARRSVG